MSTWVKATYATATINGDDTVWINLDKVRRLEPYSGKPTVIVFDDWSIRVSETVEQLMLQLKEE